MKLEIDSKQIIGKGIDFNQYFFLYCLYVDDKQEIRDYIKVNKISTESLDKLKNLAYICNKNIDQTKYTFDTIELTDKFKIEFFPSKEGVEEWFDTWYDLFPKGVKSGGYPLRSGREDCLKKMIKFVKDFPEYNKGIIIGATSKYLSEMKQKNYAYCKLASYLIFKDGISTLNGLCEGFLHSTSQPDLDNKEQGKTSLGTKDF